MKKLFLILIPLFAFLFLACNSEEEKVEVSTGVVQENVQEVSQKEPLAEIIEYEILGENVNTYGDVLLDVLIDESVATEENIVELVKSIRSSNDEIKVIKVFQDERAWNKEYEDWESDEYIEIFDKGYLAYVIDSEIRWFQEKGQLEHLSGTRTEL